MKKTENKGKKRKDIIAGTEITKNNDEEKNALSSWFIVVISLIKLPSWCIETFLKSTDIIRRKTDEKRKIFNMVIPQNNLIVFIAKANVILFEYTSSDL